MPHWTETLFREQAGLFARTFEERFETAAEEMDRLLALLDGEFGLDPDRTLDVACGTGRHVLALADRGCAAEGLDFSADFVDEARQRARDRGLADRTTFYHEDMRELDDWTGAYDLVTNCWNSLGYYDRETDERVLAAIRRLLSDDGVFAVELGNKDFYLREFDETSVSEFADRLTVDRRSYDVETGRFSTTADWFDATDDGYDHVDTLEWEQRMYAPVVLRELCADAGFEDVRLFGGFDGRELTLEESTVVALAR